jgi:hypothetical protein
VDLGFGKNWLETKLGEEDGQGAEGAATAKAG